MNWRPIDNHGVIGDLRTVALFAMDGPLDFMSFPDFGSPTMFAEHLDRQQGGDFRIGPVLRNSQHNCPR